MFRLVPGLLFGFEMYVKHFLKDKSEIIYNIYCKYGSHVNAVI